MKIRVLAREEELFEKQGDTYPMYSNPDENLHPFKEAREYTRAVVAAKMEKIFAKPFVASLSGHTDSVAVVRRMHKSLHSVATGSLNGELRIWDIGDKSCFKAVRAHDGFIRGVAFSEDDKYVLTCGDDKVIRRWDMNSLDNQDVHQLTSDVSNLSRTIEPSRSYTRPSIFTSIDHCWTNQQFCTTGDAVCVWTADRASPLHVYNWDTVNYLTLRYNPSMSQTIVVSDTDNCCTIYDLRVQSAVQKMTLPAKANGLSWNPRVPSHFYTACENGTITQFDIRRLDASLAIYSGFTNAVTDVDVSPLGTHIVGACYDRTVRVFSQNRSRAQHVYHTKRMQAVLGSQFTGDGRFIVTGSTDFDIRIWKTNPSEKLGILNTRERFATRYREALKDQYRTLPEIRRMLSHNHVPKYIKSYQRRQTFKTDAVVRKKQNMEKDAARGGKTHEVPAARKRAVLDVED